MGSVLQTSVQPQGLPACFNLGLNLILTMEATEAPIEPEDDGLFAEFIAKCPALKDKDEETCYKEIFRCFDSARKGFVSIEEFREYFVKVQGQVQMTDAEIDLLIKDIDKNDDKKVDFGEFWNFMLK